MSEKLRPVACFASKRPLGHRASPFSIHAGRIWWQAMYFLCRLRSTHIKRAATVVGVHIRSECPWLIRHSLKDVGLNVCWPRIAYLLVRASGSFQQDPYRQADRWARPGEREERDAMSRARSRCVRQNLRLRSQSCRTSHRVLPHDREE